MENWRKNQGINNHQVGHWRSSFYNGKQPLDNSYMNMHSNVMNWEDYAIKEAFKDAKFRFWAENNGFPCNIPLPDPNMYIDDVDMDTGVEPEVYQDLDREVEGRSNMKKRGNEAFIIDNSLCLKQSFSGLGWGLGPTGWKDGDKEVIKSPEPSYVGEGWRSSNHENNETNFWEGNDSQRWIPKEQYSSELHDKYQASNGWNRNWGAWEGNNIRTENSMSSWSKNPAYQHGNYEYKMNSGRGNRGRGRGRGRGGGEGRGQGKGRGRGRRGRRGNNTPNS